jgi:hypothetical protein
LSNSQLKLRKASPERLRSLGLDESWLQGQIAQDTSLLGLGELYILRKEKTQPSGGRIDFFMADPETETRYEIEVMLGELDASHIIRTIEYWDIERQRYPDFEHRAVIVAEEVTARFFNVIRLLNRAVPIIALQLSAFRFGDEVVLQFTRVLDTYELAAPDEDEGAESVDRGYWERKSRPESLAVVESIRGLTPTDKGEPRITYNRYHIALGTTGYNFCWFYPRKAAPHCNVHIKMDAEKRQEVIDQLEGGGIEAENHRRTEISLKLDVKDIQAHRGLIANIVGRAEEWSHR